MKRASFALLTAGSVAFTLIAVRESAEAQRVDPRRPSTVVVGAPPGASPMGRVDGARSGRTKTQLPAGTLRIAWQKATGLTLDQPALSGEGGMLAVVSVRGDVSFIDESGEERATVKGTGGQSGPAVMTSDGTVVFATNAGDIVGVRRSQNQPRFVVRVGGLGQPRAAPLSLDDGGAVVATASELVMIDSEGNVRSRVTLPEAPSSPLIAAGDKIVAISGAGTVFGWTPGREALRLGSFGGPVDGGATLTEGGTLLAVTGGNRLVELDLTRGQRSTRAIETNGVFLGPPANRTADAGASIATVLALTPNRGFVVALDSSGQEILRAPIATLTPTVLPDGGTAAVVAPPHTGPIVDRRGAVAFATTDGRVGVVGPDGAVDTLGETFCAKTSRFGILGITPTGPGSFVVSCDGGALARVTQSSGSRP